MELKNKRVLITGGSSGIGLATAQALLAKGAQVFVTGRDDAKIATALKTLSSGGKVAGTAADVAKSEGRHQTLEKAIAAMGGIDILINNAGGVRAGRLEKVSEGEIETMIAVNVTAPILLTRASLPALRQSGDALVVNVSSGIALIGMPFYTTYAAVKAGIAHFGEALRRELYGEGIGVLTVYPTATETPMMATSNAGRETGRERPEDVAAAIVAAIESDDLEVIRGGEARLKMLALNRQNPRAVDGKMAETKAALEEAVKNHSAL
jgi:short-subunit dehydrogenase